MPGLATTHGAEIKHIIDVAAAQLESQIRKLTPISQEQDAALRHLQRVRECVDDAITLYVQ